MEVMVSAVEKEEGGEEQGERMTRREAAGDDAEAVSQTSD